MKILPKRKFFLKAIIFFVIDVAMDIIEDYGEWKLLSTQTMVQKYQNLHRFNDNFFNGMMIVLEEQFSDVKFEMYNLKSRNLEI